MILNIYAFTGSLEADTQVVAELASLSYSKDERYFPKNSWCNFYDNFSLDDFRKKRGLKNVAACMVCCTCNQKSSANYLAPRVFSQKGNGVSIFGHTFLSISQNFFDFCAKFFRKTTKLFYKICSKKREHYAALKKRHHGGRFFGPKKT